MSFENIANSMLGEITWLCPFMKISWKLKNKYYRSVTKSDILSEKNIAALCEILNPVRDKYNNGTSESFMDGLS